MKYLLFILPVLCSCCSANWHLKQAKKHLIIAESKGAKIESDSVKKKVPVSLILPKSESSADFSNMGDGQKFDQLIKKNDSLVSQLAVLKMKPCPKFQTGVSLTSPAVDAQKVKQLEYLLAVSKKQMKKQFYKDSTYSFNPDSLTYISFTLKGGVATINYKRKTAIIKDTIDVTVGVNQKISAGYGFQEMAVLGTACAFVGFVIGLFVYAKRKKDAVHN